MQNISHPFRARLSRRTALWAGLLAFLTSAGSNTNLWCAPAAPETAEQGRITNDAPGQVVFEDGFMGRLGDGWTWIREHREAWRASERGLEVRLEPGNMWGSQNDAKNVLVRPAPDPSQSRVQVAVTVENHPTNQYEQVDLVWYYNDSNMVKLGLELVDAKLCVVMGREENDKTRTVAIIPVESTTMQLRFFVLGTQIRGEFRSPEAQAWRQAGECSLPASTDRKPMVSLQFYQGTEAADHWARVSQFRVLVAPENPNARKTKTATGDGSEPMPGLQAFVVSHTHSDFAWPDSIAGCLDKNVAAVAKSVELAAKYPDFRFCMEHMLAVRENLRRNPDKLEDIRKLTLEGRFEAGGFFTGPWELTSGGEALIRQLYFGKRG